MPSPIERLKIYKKINNVESHDDLKILSSNLEDRCGKIPKETLNLIDNIVKSGSSEIRGDLMRLKLSISSSTPIELGYQIDQILSKISKSNED